MILINITNGKNEVIKYQKKKYGKFKRFIKTMLSMCLNMYSVFFSDSSLEIF